MPETYTIRRPDNFHVHFRHGKMARHIIPHTTKIFGRAVVMPNLKNRPVTTTEKAGRYREEILQSVADDVVFTPLMTLYLTDETTRAEIKKAKRRGIFGIKLYPAGATTHSRQGVTNIFRRFSIFETMEELDLPLLIHGEISEAEDPSVDIFDREAVFIERHLMGIVGRFPQLRIVLEHVSTLEGVRFVQHVRPRVAATVTVQHLMYNRNFLFSEGIGPHQYCLPVLKREKHRQAIAEAVLSGAARFFFGSDSAPHDQKKAKEISRGCAGIFSEPVTLPLLAEFFEKHGALDKLERFISEFGARFHNLPFNKGQVTLMKEPWQVPQHYNGIVPLAAGETLQWKVVE